MMEAVQLGLGHGYDKMVYIALYNSVNNVLHSEQSVPETGHPLICPSHWYMCVIRESLFLSRWAR